MSAVLLDDNRAMRKLLFVLLFAVAGTPLYADHFVDGGDGVRIWYTEVGKGSPVIVSGYVYTSEYEDRDGIRRSTLEMRATAVGPDLSRCIARVEKTVSSGSATGATDAEAEKEPDSAETAADAEAALPLSA